MIFILEIKCGKLAIIDLLISVDIYPKVKVSITTYTQANIGLVKYLTMELSKLITRLFHMHYPRPITWGKIISLLCRL